MSVSIPTNKHTKRIDDLIRLAEAHPGSGGAKVVAAIYHGNKAYYGFNTSKTHPFHAKFSGHANKDAIFLHAETAAIYNASRHMSPSDLASCSLYVARVKRPHKTAQNWIVADAKPCQKGCQQCI